MQQYLSRLRFLRYVVIVAGGLACAAIVAVALYIWRHYIELSAAGVLFLVFGIGVLAGVVYIVRIFYGQIAEAGEILRRGGLKDESHRKVDAAAIDDVS